MTDSNSIAPEPSTRTWRHRLGQCSLRGPAMAVALLVAGVAVGAGSLSVLRPSPQVTLLTPGPVSALAEWHVGAVKGQVAEIFGNKFVIEDPSGRALIETGRAGEGGDLVTPNETVTVQGRFEHGFLHATLIVHPDGHADPLGPPGPPHARFADLVHRLHRR